MGGKSCGDKSKIPEGVNYEDKTAMVNISTDNLLSIICVLGGVVVSLAVYVVLSISRRVDDLEKRCIETHRKK